MSETLDQIRQLILEGKVRISDHGYDELAADGILAREAVEGIADAALVEDYPDYPKGPCVLLRQTDRTGEYIHVLWGIPKGKAKPAVLITAYRPDTEMWDNDLLKRKR
ncbi:MAG: DUF4258 domain-containing protein [Acidobacteria bacterium]|nr:DUF4258 domain-containing protein [Acidobacteriota bacterium]MCW5948241.1 DUF4258 domain-containing protein [Pyrinomonadaceae bacterium]